MCGRFAFYSPAEAAAALFDFEPSLTTEPRYNIAPTQPVPVVRNTQAGGRALTMLRWGLVPFWARDPSIGQRMINARAETLSVTPAYRNAYEKRRCLILADGFYEWRKHGPAKKQPYYISKADGQPFAFAGLWEAWTDRATGESLRTTAIVTTAANDFLKELHDRMPVVLEPETARAWLAGDAGVLDATKGSPPLQAWPVDTRVNNAAHEGAELIARTAAA